MLRTVLLATGVVTLGFALLAALFGAPFPVVLWLAVVGAGLLGGILLERGRYKPPTPERPGRGWVATDERFLDPDTGKTVMVYYQPSTGERRYVGQ
ncbi:MAG TPA: hypothetical protein VM782_23090 [Stellaceae bacterium]|nr:hypothetical protein [Stellaceae bacterium]